MAGMTRIEMKPGPWNITDPAWPRFEAIDLRKVGHSDGFAGDGPLKGRTTDSAYGGAPATWDRNLSQPELWTTSGGALRLTPGPITVNGFAHSLATFTARVTIVAPINGDLWIEPWKGGTPTSYTGKPTLRALMRTGGRIEPIYRDASGAIVGTGPTAQISAGQILKMVVSASKFTLMADDVIISSVAHGITDLTAPHFFGMSNGTNAGGLVLDDLILIAT